MARILITSGPTREYLDPVRFLTNASSGRMGSALAAAALQAGHEVVVVSGPVQVDYPAAARVVPVCSTGEMLAACQVEFPACDGLIAAAAPCDYRPRSIETDKIRKTGGPLQLELVETPDIVATLSSERQPGQWVVCFALETADARSRAWRKLQAKHCDLIVINGPQAIEAAKCQVEILARSGQLLATVQGHKPEVATRILQLVTDELASPGGAPR